MKQDYSFFIGDVALDEYYQAPKWPNIREKVLVQTLEPQMGGSMANAACVYARFNESVYFLSLLNSGNITQLLCEDLRKQGINTNYILYDDSLPDSKCIVILAENEHTLFIPTLGINKFEITPEIIDAMCNAKYVYSTILEIKPLRCGDMDAIDIIKKIRASGTKIVYDLDVALLEEGDEIFLHESDIVFFNQVGIDSYRKDMSIEEAVSVLLNYGTEIVVITLAEEGCLVYSKEQQIQVKGISVDIVDVTGAGDTFCSSFIYGLNKCNDLRLIASFANAAAARAVTIMGARGGVATVQEILDFLEESGFEIDELNIFL
ncbi:carbohydrate kinase family protein [Bacillus sp. S/N-304-OC-R1]|uniref:carbohydrate kinase family protein n=1 Tax=Bacillus sp. S/N-304-OC-R1 TaxID=2758034 RepID=UPI001C8EB3F5|nr:carbohydrate kinase family protein [Bacillus sp. S/N-304-OC-R1]MBY0122914.1 carbohydrate kinase family protein [Bacillus sp. S/N-304-OC-R1]